MTVDEVVSGLERGHTLPARWYHDPAVLDLERERIFARSWQVAARADEVAEPGSYVATETGGMPIVVVRDGDGVLHAHANVCLHRGHHLVEGSGRCTTLQCPYHAWTYGLDGRLRKAPRADREPGLDLDGMRLRAAAVDSWGPLVFVHPDPAAPPLAEHLGELPAVVASCGVDVDRLRFRARTEWTLAANWKIGVENYLECYHCQVAHPGLSRLVDVRPEAYALRTGERFSYQVGPLRGESFGDAEVPHAQWHWLWPNVALNVEPGLPNLSVDRWIPDGPARTRGVTDYFFAPEVPADVADDVMAFSAAVGAEDTSLIEAVQRGMESGAIDSGRVMPESERLVAHFERLVADALRAG